jgi:pimeloyl-ACP methyl ester carboxylesterase
MKTFTVGLLMLAAATIGLSSYTNRTNKETKTFVLVHGAWQAPYAWQNVKQQLESKGEKVVVVELPGHGDDQTSPAQLSMDVYRDKVVDAINNADGKVILVGHSMGGMVVSSVAEKIPSKIEKLVYIGAFVPTDNQSLLELSMMDKQSLLGASLVPSQDQLTLDVKKENLINIFCQDATKDEQDVVMKNYRAEPAIPFTNKVHVSDANFGSVDKYYIHTTQDHAVGMDLQNQMIKTANITNVYSLNSSHCPFISQPKEVTKLLMKIAD